MLPLLWFYLLKLFQKNARKDHTSGCIYNNYKRNILVKTRNRTMFMAHSDLYKKLLNGHSSPPTTSGRHRGKPWLCMVPHLHHLSLLAMRTLCFEHKTKLTRTNTRRKISLQLSPCQSSLYITKQHNGGGAGCLEGHPESRRGPGARVGGSGRCFCQEA